MVLVGGGTVLVDWSQNAQDGTLTNLDLAVAWERSAGQFRAGWSIVLDGVDGHVDCGAFNELEEIDEFTISMWVRSQSGTSGGETFAAKFGGGADTFELRWAGSENVIFDVRDNGNTLRTATFVDGIEDAEWHHLVGTIQGGLVRVYIDGVQGGGTEVMSLPTQASAHNLHLGQRTDGTNMFDGVIDEIRVYDRGLTQLEVQSLYFEPYLEFEPRRQPVGLAVAAVENNELWPSRIAITQP